MTTDLNILAEGDGMSEQRTTCLIPVWDDGIYRVRCSMGTKGVCARHGKHQPHPNDGKPCKPNAYDGYCHQHGVYMDPYAAQHDPEADT